ncbi:hypothetical protein [Bradyrhizobium canariense]|uniref:hypothetical protein n=1 Tax=Bradyrhizobium canariense TaxID=255045 RepID=UPI00117899F5|nr:hypothetical protein [Bradyrhizobium canariense]
MGYKIENRAPWRDCRRAGRRLGEMGLRRRAKQDYKGIIANFGYSKILGFAAPTFPSAGASIAPPPPSL